MNYYVAYPTIKDMHINVSLLFIINHIVVSSASVKHVLIDLIENGMQ